MKSTMTGKKKRKKTNFIGFSNIDKKSPTWMTPSYIHKDDIRKKKLLGNLNGVNIISSNLIPPDEVWFVKNDSFKFRKPRVLPRFKFRLFGYEIKIFIKKI